MFITRNFRHTVVMHGKVCWGVRGDVGRMGMGVGKCAVVWRGGGKGRYGEVWGRYGNGLQILPYSRLSVV